MVVKRLVCDPPARSPRDCHQLWDTQEWSCLTHNAGTEHDTTTTQSTTWGFVLLARSEHDGARNDSAPGNWCHFVGAKQVQCGVHKCALRVGELTDWRQESSKLRTVMALPLSETHELATPPGTQKCTGNLHPVAELWFIAEHGIMYSAEDYIPLKPCFLINHPKQTVHKTPWGTYSTS